MSFLASALIAIGSSFVPASQDPCAGQTLYYRNNAGQYIVATKPLNQGCSNTLTDACKYYQSAPGVFTPCSTSIYGRAPYTP